MRRQVDADQDHHVTRQVEIRVHPVLRLAVAGDAVDVVDVDRNVRIAQLLARYGILLRAARRHPRVADGEQHPHDADPDNHAAAVVADLPHQIKKQEWQPEVEERQESQEERRLEHVARHASHMDPAHFAEEIDNPDHLRHEDADQKCGQEQRTLEPNRDHGAEQGDIAEEEEVRRPIVLQVDRKENRHERGIRDLDPERNERRRGGGHARVLFALFMAWYGASSSNLACASHARLPEFGRWRRQPSRSRARRETSATVSSDNVRRIWAKAEGWPRSLLPPRSSHGQIASDVYGIARLPPQCLEMLLRRQTMISNVHLGVCTQRSFLSSDQEMLASGSFFISSLRRSSSLANSASSSS